MSGRSSASKDTIRNGDLVWVVYRKTPWPAKVKIVYPKKITYNFLPLTQKPAVFSSDPKNVYLFKTEDELEGECADDLKHAYSVAKRMLNGEDVGLEDSALMAAQGEELNQTEEGQQNNVLETTMSTTTTSTSNATPPSASSSKSSNKKKEKKAKNSIPALEKNGNGRILAQDANSAEEEHDIYVEKIVKDGAERPVFNKGDAVVIETPQGMWPAQFGALVAEEGIVYCQMFPLSDGTEYVKVEYDKVIPFPREELSQMIDDNKDINASLANAFKSVRRYLRKWDKEREEQKEMAQKAQKSSSKKDKPSPKTAAVDPPSESPSKSRKRRHAEEELGRSSGVVSSSTSADPAAKKARSSDTAPVISTTATTTADSITSPSKGTRSTKIAKVSPPEAVKEKKPKKSKGEGKEEVSVKKKPLKLLDVITSYEGQQFIKAIFNDHPSFELPERVEDLVFDFKNGGLLTFDEVEKAVGEIMKEYSLSTKLPHMQHLCKMQYISRIVLPNLCIFGLSKMHKCSTEEAKGRFQLLLVTEAQLPAKKEKSRTHSNGLPANNGEANAFNELLIAANILEGAEQQKNGDAAILEDANEAVI